MKKVLIAIGKVTVFIFLWIAIISIGFSIIDKFTIHNKAVLRLWWEVIPLIFAIILTFIFIKFIDKDKFQIKISILSSKNIIAIVIGLCWIFIPIFILRLLGYLEFNGKNTVTQLPIWIIAMLINVIMQELLVRGYIFNLFKESYSSIVAVIVTTLLFLALHGGAFEEGIIAILNIITMSIFMSLLLIYTDNLLVPIIVHFIWNCVGSIGVGLISVAEDYPVLWNFSITGRKLISGGLMKLEGSIVVTAINFILVIIICFVKRHRDNSLIFFS